MSRQIENKKNNKKKNKRLAAILIAVGVISTIAVIIMAILGVFDTTEVKEIRSSREDRKVVGEIGGYKVRYEELKYVTFVLKDQYRAKYGADIFDTEESAAKYRDQLEADVIEALKEIYSTVAICDELGIKVNNADAKDYTQAQLEDIVEKNFGGDFDAYLDYIAMNNLTDAFMRFKTKTVYLDLQAKEKMVEKDHAALGYSQANFKEFIEHVLNSDSYSRIYYVIVDKSETGAKEKAEEIYADLLAIEDTDDRFSRMKYHIGHSVTMIPASGHYVVSGTMGQSFDDAVASMGMYGVGISETEDEYFVMMKMPKVEQQIKDGFDTMLATYQEIAYTKYKSDVAAGLEFVGNSYYDGLDLINIVD